MSFETIWCTSLQLFTLPAIQSDGLPGAPVNRSFHGRFARMNFDLVPHQWSLHWTEEERGEFATYIAEYPDVGDVVPESGGIRKVRWRRAGSGKSGGVRVIYFTRTVDEQVVLLTLYAKSKTDNITGAKLKEIRRALES